MPLLNWQAPKAESVVSHRFWIYWAVTIPLTAAVLLLWSTWYLLTGYHGAQPHLTDRKGPRDGSSRQGAFKMHVLTVFGLDRMRQKFRGLFDNDTTGRMTNNIA